MKIIKKRIVKGKKGSVVHMYDKQDKILSKVGEVYFSNILPKEIKAWKQTNSEQYLCVPRGQVLFVVKNKQNFKRIKLGYPMNYKVLYITYNQDNIDMLRKKRYKVRKLDAFDLEEHLSSMTEETYNFCRADSHPTWEEFKAGNIHPEFLSGPNDVKLDNDPLNDWTYNTPDDNKLCCEIKFNSILHGYDIVDNIADLLEVKIRSDQKSLLDEYREKFFEVDY